jgi:hypothetical protein
MIYNTVVCNTVSTLANYQVRIRHAIQRAGPSISFWLIASRRHTSAYEGIRRPIFHLVISSTLTLPLLSLDCLFIPCRGVTYLGDIDVSHSIHHYARIGRSRRYASSTERRYRLGCLSPSALSR